MTIERHGPEFVKDQHNFVIYDALLHRTNRRAPKENKWVTKYGVELRDIHKKYRKTIAHSSVKGFMWLFCNHALPVGARMWGNHIPCPRCGETETIKHMAFSCKWVKDLRGIVLKEWWARSGDQIWTDPHGFAAAFFNEYTGPTAEILDAVMAITAHKGWKNRNKILYEGEAQPPALAVANMVWTEIEHTIIARLNHLHKQTIWWRNRETVELATPELVLEHTEEILKEMNEIASFLPQRAIPNTLVELVKPMQARPVTIDSEDFISLEKYPVTYPLTSWKWRLTTVKSKDYGTLDASSDSKGEEEERGNSADESGEGNPYG
jgi:hypothetical protein